MPLFIAAVRHSYKKKCGDHMSVLERDDLENRLASAAGWTLRGAEIQKQFQFHDFRDAMAFVTRVAELAEKANHHPDVLIQYNKVTLTLSTHSEGGITEKDFDLARDVDFI